MDRDARVQELLYSCDSREELCERITKLEELASELFPYVGDSCPDECLYREECEGEDNRGSDGWALCCVAYNHYIDKMRDAGIEVIS